MTGILAELRRERAFQNAHLLRDRIGRAVGGMIGIALNGHRAIELNDAIVHRETFLDQAAQALSCLLYTSDAADE